ncbi:MAG: aminopeptidase [Deltaproteobacteria bacterium]|nr:aminopeptidase [Deltaproteobacteria bacterium]
MNDPRLTELAQLLANYSLDLQPGQRVLIEWFGTEPAALVHAMVAAATRRGAVPVWQHGDDRFVRTLLLEGTEAQVKAFGALQLQQMKQFDAYVAFRGSDNIFEMSDVPPERRQWYLQHVQKPVHLEQRVKHTRWCVLRYPNAAMAQLAETSCERFADHYFKAVLFDYARFREAMRPLQALMQQTDRVRITAPGTDLTFSIKGIPAMECDGTMNLPDGEVFTAPVRDSIQGTIRYNTPSPYQGRLFQRVGFTFRNGQIVEASCEGDQAALQRVLDTDPGARYVGEFAVGFHPWIREPIKDILFDEKIAGSIHLTPGQCYDEAPNGNQSAVHWDLVLIQRKEYGGGELYFDDRLVRKDGHFVLPELAGLNPEAFGAPAC